MDYALKELIVAMVSALPHAQPHQLLQQQQQLPQLQQLLHLQQPVQQPQPQPPQPQLKQNNAQLSPGICVSTMQPLLDIPKHVVHHTLVKQFKLASACAPELIFLKDQNAGPTLILQEHVLMDSNVCTVFTDNAACLEAGIAGFNICKIGALNQDVPQECCNPTPSGSTKVFCLPSTDTSVTDKFCMEYGIAKDQPCGTTAEYNHLGYCDVGTDCINGACSATTTTTTTTTSTTSTTTEACIEDGNPCWQDMALVNQGICCSTGQRCDVQNPMMTTNC